MVGRGRRIAKEDIPLPEPARVPRARHGARKRCSDPAGTGCRGFARRNHDACYDCGGGTRNQAKHLEDGTMLLRNKVPVSPRVQALLNGQIDVEELDDDELVRGYMRSRDGSFKGRLPRVVPKAIHDRMIRELFARADDMLRSSLLDAVTVMSEVAADKNATPGERLKAAQWIYERVRGKVPTDVHITGEMKPYEELLDDVHRGAPIVDLGTVNGDDDRY